MSFEAPRHLFKAHVTFVDFLHRKATVDSDSPELLACIDNCLYLGGSIRSICEANGYELDCGLMSLHKLDRKNF
jgi:hypothetical protein